MIGARTSDRIVVSGIGMVSPLGSRESTWSRVLAGESGIGTITRFDASSFPCQVAGEVKDEVPSISVDDWGRHYLTIDFAVAAFHEAMTDARMNLQDTDEGVGLVVATHGIAPSLRDFRLAHSASATTRQHLREIQKTGFVARSLASVVAGGGPVTGLTTACSSGAMALIEGARLLRSGDASLVVVGGTDAVLSEIYIIAFGNLGALTQHVGDPAEACRPFDRRRSGFVISEGACFLVLETEKAARERGVEPYGALTGWAAVVATNHLTSSHSDGVFQARCMTQALIRSEKKAKSVDYINAHGTGTLDNDPAEASAIRNVFGERSLQFPVSSTKGATGHLIGAAGALEAAMCLLSMRDKAVPATRNLDEIDPDCRLGHVIGPAACADVEVAISNSFGLGGSNVSVVLERL